MVRYLKSQARMIGVGSLLLGTQLGGCGGGKDVDVGADGAALNLDSCEATSCSSDLDTGTIAQPKKQTCDVPHTGTLTQSFELDLWQELCPDPSTCSPQITASAVGHDESLWVLGTYSRMTANHSYETLWLRHYSAEGALLGKVNLGFGVPLIEGGETHYEADVTVNAEDNAVVLVYESDGGPNADSEVGERAWMQAFGASGDPVGAPVELSGFASPRIITDGRGRLILAGDALDNAKHAVLAAFSPDQTRLWSQNDVRSYGRSEGAGMSGIAADGKGAVSVLSQRDWEASEPAIFGVSRFDEHGKLVWDKVFETTFADGYGAGFGGDDAGNTVMFGQLPDKVLDNGLTFSQPLITSVDVNGKARWSYEFKDDSGSGALVDHETGDVYFSSVATNGVDPATQTLVRISQDGKTCRRYDYPKGYGAAGMLSPSGALYFAGGTSIGRFEPIDDE